MTPILETGNKKYLTTVGALIHIEAGYLQFARMEFSRYARKGEHSPPCVRRRLGRWHGQ